MRTGLTTVDGRSRRPWYKRAGFTAFARRFALVVTAVVVGAGLAAPAAQAGPAAPNGDASIAASCNFHVGFTIKDGTIIRGSGSLTSEQCSGAFNALHLILQRERWYGWEPMDDNWRYTPGSSGVSWNCSGAGTYTYRVWAEAHFVITNSWSVKTSNRLRTAC